jgi:hypothetical protein
MAQRDSSTIEKLTGFSARELTTRALIDEDFAKALSSKMWTPAAQDGRKMKVGTLYSYIQANGFAPLAPQTKNVAIFAAASEYRKKVAANQVKKKKLASPGM